MQLTKDKKNQSIEITKALLLFHLIHNLQTSKILKLINMQLHNHINLNGIHKSMNPCTHAEYINNLYEIKNMCLYFNVKTPKEIEYQIINMSSVLKNLFHKDNSIALFKSISNILSVFSNALYFLLCKIFVMDLTTLSNLTKGSLNNFYREEII